MAWGGSVDCDYRCPAARRTRCPSQVPQRGNAVKSRVPAFTLVPLLCRGPTLRFNSCLFPTARGLARGSADKDEDGRRELTVATELHWRDTDPEPEPNGPDRPETTDRCPSPRTRVPQRGNGMKPRVAAFTPLPWVGRPSIEPNPVGVDWRAVVDRPGACPQRPGRKARADCGHRVPLARYRYRPRPRPRAEWTGPAGDHARTGACPQRPVSWREDPPTRTRTEGAN
jgi:hypothetical protein